MQTPDEDQQLAVVVERLTAKFPHIPREHIEEIVAEVHRDFDGNPVRDYIPVLVEHEVKAELRDEEAPA